MNVIAADNGGTNSRLAWIAPGDNRQGFVRHRNSFVNEHSPISKPCSPPSSTSAQG
jgi:hexokinase